MKPYLVEEACKESELRKPEKLGFFGFTHSPGRVRPLQLPVPVGDTQPIWFGMLLNQVHAAR